MPKAQNASFMSESERFGPGAWAARHGVLYDPSRPSLLKRMSDAVAPKEFRARLAQILSSVNGLTNDVLKKIESSKMTIVLRAYGSKAMSYFLQDKSNHPIKRATAIRGVVSAASGAAVAKAKSVNAEKLADLKTASADAEFRNVTDERIIRSALDGHRDWKTFAEWFSSMTASIDARFTGLREIAANKPDRHVFQIPGQENRTIDMERGLFNTVASGYGPDGLPTKDMAKAKRSTFIGRRVAVLPYLENQDRSKELIEVARKWGDALLADFRVSFKPAMGLDDIAMAQKKGYPIYKDKDGFPVAHLVYDSRGGNVLLPMKSLGFRDIGRKNDLTPTHFSPDRLEAKFGSNFVEYMKTAFGRRATPEVSRSNGIPLRRMEKPQPVTRGLGLSFGEIAQDINPANTAIVFSNGSSNRFTLVHISTGNPISGLPVLGISNLPKGDYVRLTHETLKDWKEASLSERGPLRERASGSVRISDGWVMTHLDSDGRPHNTFDGPAIVQATRNEMGIEDNPRPISWAHHGTSMSKEDFMKLRYRERLSARMAEEKIHSDMLNDPFGLALEKNKDRDISPKLPGMH